MGHLEDRPLDGHGDKALDRSDAVSAPCPRGSATLATAMMPIRDVRLVSNHSGMKQGETDA